MHDALETSESKVAELSDELNRKRAPKSKFEERADVLAHRLESVEAEREHWKTEANQLEVLIDNERAKIEQLKKKLDVAESGPDKLTKKEVNYWRDRAEQFDTETSEYKKRITALKTELNNQRDAQPEASQNNELELNCALEEARGVIEALRSKLQEREERLESYSESSKELSDQAGALQIQVEELQQSLQHQESSHSALTDTISDRDARLVELSAQLEQARAELKSRDDEMAALRIEVENAAAGNAENDRALSELQESERATQSDRDELRVALAERERQYQELCLKLESAERTDAEHQEQVLAAQLALEERDQEFDQLRADIKRIRAERSQLKTDLSAASSTTNEKSAEHKQLIATLNGLVSQRDEKIASLEAAKNQFEEQQEAAREQIAGLEEELKEEKECTVNLGELANERREEVTKLAEKLEEVEERYEETKWRLGKAEHFERLVRKRKKLVSALIVDQRARIKSSAALKAGLDGLRTFKATAERNQQNQLLRIETLTTELKGAQETLAKFQAGTVAKEELTEANARVTELEKRLNTQIELIESLENELKASKANRQSTEDQAQLVQALKSEIATRDEAIAKLEADAHEQQKKLSKLRGSESETMRLKALKEADQTLIDSVQQENKQLKAAVARLEGESKSTAATNASDGSAELRKRDSTIAQLNRTLKEQEREVKKLSEAVSGWQKKYEFLSTEAPTAYQSAVEK